MTPDWTRVILPYGDGEVSVRLPSNRLQSILSPPEPPSIKPAAHLVADALAHPIESARLRDTVRPGETVAVLVSDVTRLTLTDQFLPLVLDELYAGGVRDRDIHVVFANGCHRAHTPVECQRVLGDEVLTRVNVVDHDAWATTTSLATTRRGTPVEVNPLVAGADRRILTGSIVHHWIAGYGGGRKAILPGVSSHRTNVINHALMLEPGSQTGRLSGNPVHEDMVEAVGHLSPDFLLNTVINANRVTTDVVAGHWIAAHEAGCRIVDQRCGADLPARTDVVIASCGGYPRDINIYQAQKSLENAIRAVQPGGLVILVAECRDGHGSDMFRNWMQRFQSTTEMKDHLRKNFVIGGHKAFGYARLLDHARIVLVSSLSRDLVETFRLLPASNVEEALHAHAPRDASIAVMPAAAITYPIIGAEASTVGVSA